MSTIRQRLASVHQLMKNSGVDYYLVPSIDQHNNEYVPECWQRRPWISGFDGSAGEVLLTPDGGLLWTDGRYFLQAEQQLDNDFFTLKKQSGLVSELESWLETHITGKVLGVDPALVSLSRAERLMEIATRFNGEVRFLEDNLIDQARRQMNEMPPMPDEPVSLHAVTCSGQSTASKLAWLTDQLQAHGADAIVLNNLDEIAWLYNLRGNDIAFNPLVISYAIIDTRSARFFVDEHKLSANVQAALRDQGITVHSYEAFATHLQQLDGCIWVDGRVAHYWLVNQLPASVTLLTERSPVTLTKAIKNDTELQGAQKAHRVDAVAVIRFLHWLENHWQEGVDELQAINQLEAFRRENPDYRGKSFDTICGFGPHGAIIHYRSSPATTSTIDADDLLLIDSGGQYPYGTTDVTRTLHLGTPGREHREYYTRVLQGHLQLRHARFPHGTCGEHLDALARLPLWQCHANYAHGTGHGVGSFLCVHEGPQKISQGASGVPLQSGMIVSNEPGFYINGAYGIRIENLIYISKAADCEQSPTGHGPFYQFHDLTLIPYSRKLIDKSLLSSRECEWINAYHRNVWETISPMLEQPEVRAWLKEATAAL